MSFQFRAHDVRGLERAAGECNPIALVAGPNAAGKTSLAQAIAAALTGDALPVEGMTKANAGLFVRAGAGIGRVEIANEQGTASIAWPAMQVTREGKAAPQASAYAAGLSTVATMAPRDRARVLAEYLRADPTFEDLQVELTDWPADTIAAVWRLIEQQGWDKAHALRKDRGAELKGRWRQITGLNYGSRIAANWRPDLADPSLNEPELMAAVARAQAEHDNAVSASAVSNAARERFVDEARQLDARSGDLLQAEAAVVGCGEALQVAQQARIALPPTEQPPTMPCPHCGAPIIVNRVSLVDLRLEKPAAVPPSDGDLKQRRLAIADAEGKLAHATDALNAARRNEANARAAVERSQASRERIANWPEAIETGTDIEAAKLALSRAEKRLAEFRMKGEADDINEKIESNEIVLDLLAGDGLRARKLNKVRQVFVDQQLRALSDEAGWKRLDIDADMLLRYDGRPYGMLSSSEQYRVRLVLQLAMACLDGSDAVIVDGADILDAPARSGLFAMLDASGVSALVCMTLSRRDQVPDLEAAGIGQSYWLAGGVLEPARQAKEAA